MLQWPMREAGSTYLGRAPAARCARLEPGPHPRVRRRVRVAAGQRRLARLTATCAGCGNKPVRRKGPSLEDLLKATSDDARERAMVLLLESARHNLGAPRTINLPSLPLELLHLRNQARFVIDDHQQRPRRRLPGLAARSGRDGAAHDHPAAGRRRHADARQRLGRTRLGPPVQGGGAHCGTRRIGVSAFTRRGDRGVRARREPRPDRAGAHAGAVLHAASAAAARAKRPTRTTGASRQLGGWCLVGD